MKIRIIPLNSNSTEVSYKKEIETNETEMKHNCVNSKVKDATHK